LVDAANAAIDSSDAPRIGCSAGAGAVGSATPFFRDLTDQPGNRPAIRVMSKPLGLADLAMCSPSFRRAFIGISVEPFTYILYTLLLLSIGSGAIPAV